MVREAALKTVVIKIGTKVLTDSEKEYRLSRPAIKTLADQVSELVKRDVRVVLVSSGAICSGMGLLGLKKRPKKLAGLQACAAVGQCHLMNVYNEFFRAHNLLTAQVLLTREDLNDRKRYLNAKNTLLTLLGQRVIPIINENDTVATEEIKFGDNDRLSSFIANLVGADILILLSNIDGLYKYSGSKKEHISLVNKITSEIEGFAHKSKDELGTGGMTSKLQAIKIATDLGISCIIANGKRANVILDIADGKGAGTFFVAAPSKTSADVMNWPGAW